MAGYLDIKFSVRFESSNNLPPGTIERAERTAAYMKANRMSEIGCDAHTIVDFVDALESMVNVIRRARASGPVTEDE